MNVFNIYVYENRSMSSDLSKPLMLENLNVDNAQVHIPKEIDGTDMGTWAWWFVYQNAKKEKYSIPMTLEGVTNDEGEEEYISTVGLNHGFTGKHGTVMYAIEAIRADGSGTVTHEWHTKTYKLEIVHTLQGNQTEYDESESDIISALISRVNELIQSGAEIAEIAETIEHAAETAQEVIDSIPADYSTLSAQVDTNTEDIGLLKADLLNDAIKEALLNCFNHIGWADENGKQYRDALELALYPNNVVSISATLTLGNHNVYTTDNINSLKNFLHVEATRSDGSKKEITDYSLNGDISSAGSHVITVNYNQLTTSFTVTSSTNNVGILYEWDFTKGLNDLRQNKAAVLGTGERVDYPDYTGSFVLGEGTTPPILTANGLSFNNEQQWCRLFDKNFNSSEYLADKTIQVDVASFSYAHGSEYHTRFITFADPTAKSNTDGGKLARFQDGLIFRNGYGWNYYDGQAWNDSIFGDMTDRSDISGHTVALVLNNFTYPKVYIDGVYKGTGNKNHNDIMYGLQIGDGGVASTGGTFYNALITGVRIYSGEVVN